MCFFLFPSGSCQHHPYLPSLGQLIISIEQVTLVFIFLTLLKSVSLSLLGNSSPSQLVRLPQRPGLPFWEDCLHAPRSQQPRTLPIVPPAEGATAASCSRLREASVLPICLFSSLIPGEQLSPPSPAPAPSFMEILTYSTICQHY